MLSLSWIVEARVSLRRDKYVKKVITYGTYDLLHRGHIRLLERAKALGDYLIVGVTSGDYDKVRGKINVQQSLMERIENVRATGLADEIVVEEYEGQKIDDILRYDIDVFTVGSDWIGQFDYLREYCEVVYLDRTEGISSSEIRAERSCIRLGFVGETSIIRKYFNESKLVNGLSVIGICTGNEELLSEQKGMIFFTEDYEELLDRCDAVYVASHPTRHYDQVKAALLRGKHVLCESPIAMSESFCQELLELAEKKNLVLMDAIKTAYSTAFNRMLVLIKSGKIGEILSVDATCTSLKNIETMDKRQLVMSWNSICAWGPVAMLPIFKVLGTQWAKYDISSRFSDRIDFFDVFTKVNFTYNNAVASIKVGNGVKSEGELIISGTHGYVYIPAPWWKTDYFELRYEEAENNRRYYYPLDGEGIRYELVAFLRSIRNGRKALFVDADISKAICSIVESFYNKSIITLS